MKVVVFSSEVHTSLIACNISSVFLKVKMVNAGLREVQLSILFLAGPEFNANTYCVKLLVIIIKELKNSISTFQKSL